VIEMSGQRANAPTPFDQVLAVAQFAKTEEVRHVLDELSYDLARSGDVSPWTSAIQLARDLGAIGRAEAYALLDVLTEEAIGLVTGTDARLVELEQEMREIARANGLDDDEDYYMDEAPDDWLALNRLWDQRFAQLRVELFRQIGEPAMAVEFAIRQDEFDARSREGRFALFEIPDEDEEFDLPV
jgi:hypothetical protein